MRDVAGEKERNEDPREKKEDEISPPRSSLATTL